MKKLLTLALAAVALAAFTGLGIAQEAQKAQGRQLSAKGPVHTRGRILCFGTVARNTKISVAFFDSVGQQSHTVTTTDSDGKFDVLLTCPGSNNVNEHFVIQRYIGLCNHEFLFGSGATIPSTCCCGQLGDVEVCTMVSKPGQRPVPLFLYPTDHPVGVEKAK